MFQRVFNPSKGNPAFLPSNRLSSAVGSQDDFHVGKGVEDTPSTTAEIERFFDTVPKMTLSYFLEAGGDTPLSPNSSSILFAYLFFEFRWGSGFFGANTLFEMRIPLTLHWQVKMQMLCNTCFGHLAFFTKQNPWGNGGMWWSDRVFFLDGVHLHPSGQSEMNTSRLTRCSRCDKGALLLCFFNLGNLEMIGWILSICQFPNCVSWFIKFCLLIHQSWILSFSVFCSVPRQCDAWIHHWLGMLEQNYFTSLRRSLPDQWKKGNWLFRYIDSRGWHPTQLCGDCGIMINHDIRIPIKQPVFHGK